MTAEAMDVSGEGKPFFYELFEQVCACMAQSIQLPARYQLVIRACRFCGDWD